MKDKKRKYTDIDIKSRKSKFSCECVIFALNFSHSSHTMICLSVFLSHTNFLTNSTPSVTLHLKHILISFSYIQIYLSRQLGYLLFSDFKIMSLRIIRVHSCNSKHHTCFYFEFSMYTWIMLLYSFSHQKQPKIWNKSANNLNLHLLDWCALQMWWLFVCKEGKQRGTVRTCARYCNTFLSWNNIINWNDAICFQMKWYH